ncbi:PAS domain-containing protein [Sorangium sp. So ce1182]|uniref:PAS domain-containing protein n=1 Tax=Sorangium sp. So ce1182 TaxID=3133334 RepID=UPI003F5DFB44
MSPPVSSTATLSRDRCARSQHLADGTFVAASPAAVAVYGAPPEALVGRRLLDLVAPEDVADAESALAEAMRSSDAVSFVVRLRGDGDAPRRVEIVAHAADGAAGERQLCCVARDAATAARAMAEQVQLSSRAEAMGRRLERLICSVPGIVWEIWFVDDPARQRVSFVSERAVALSGYTPEEWLSTPNFWAKITHPDDVASADATAALMAKGSASAQSRWFTKDGRIIWVETQMQVLRDEDGNPAGYCGVTIDITARKEAAQEQARLREEIIQSQARLLAELSTPLIPLSDGVVAMPLIGSLDRARAERVLDTLLHGIGASGARVAILDITGVPTVDEQVAEALLKTARGVQLLGAEVVLTGIRPEVAQALVALGAELTGIVTRGTLQDGIRYASGERRSAPRRDHGLPPGAAREHLEKRGDDPGHGALVTPTSQRRPLG